MFIVWGLDLWGLAVCGTAIWLFNMMFGYPVWIAFPVVGFLLPYLMISAMYQYHVYHRSWKLFDLVCGIPTNLQYCIDLGLIGFLIFQ